MYAKLLKKIIFMSKYAALGVVVQCLLFTVILAEDGKTQPVSLENVYVSFKLNNTSIEEAFAKIESSTDFSFAYKKKIIKHANRQFLKSDFSNESVAGVLRFISDNTGLSFKRVDETIHVVNEGEEIKESIVEVADVEISGKVTDENGEGLPGASILIKGTATGTTTNLEGEYKFTVPDDATLEVSYVGYTSQDIVLGAQSVIDVQLVPDAAQLDEIVVVGYGTVKKRDLTGSVGSIDAKKIANQSPNSVTDILRANVPGLNVGFSNSPKGVSQLEVRGQNTLTAGSSPLIIVDGMIYNGDLSDINPNDIDKVDVMKDASSAAIYGARGANGVILITTKRGESGKPTISISSSFGMVTDGNVQKPYDGAGYAKWRTDVFRSIDVDSDENTPGRYNNPDNLPAGVSLNDWLAYDGASGDPTTAWLNRIGFQDIEKENYLAGKQIDWYDRINQAGARSDLNVSLSGASDAVKYYWSIGRIKNEGLTIGDEFQTIRSRLNIEAKVNDYISVGVNTQFANRDESAVAGDRNQIVRSSPWGSEFDDDGNIRYSPQDDSGAGAQTFSLNPTYTDRLRKFNTLNSRMYGKVKLPLGFSYEIAYTTRFEWIDRFEHLSSKHPGRGEGSAYRQHDKVEEWQLDNILRWDKTVGDHTMNATFLAYAEEYQGFRDRGSTGIFSPSDDLGFNALNFGSAAALTGNDEKSTGDALMGRVNYSYKSKYLLSISMRRDGYSAFGANNKRATFPSIAAGWVLSDEEFFNTGFFDFLKMRLSWGKNGNRNIGRYGAISQLSGGKNLIASPGGSVSTVATLNNVTMANNDLKWETTKAWNFGFDFSIKEGIVDGSIDYYNMTTNDLLVARTLTNVLAYGSVLSNLGEVQNQGLEMVVNTRNMTRDNFTWSSNFNFSLNRNKIISLYGDLDANGEELDDVGNRWFIGESIDRLYGQKALGIWQSNEAELASDYGVFPGDFKILDKNDDKVFTIDDNEFLGYAKPRFRWTWVNNFTFKKNWTVSVEMYSSLGQSRSFNDAKNRNGFIDRVNSLQTPYWTAENPNTEWARLFSSQGSSSFNVYRNSSFIRLQNITVSYNIPQTVLEKISVQSLRVYANIRNVGFWAPNWELYDPEASDIDGVSGNLDSPRYFTLGVNLTL
jgi:TonB-linked SusC/RagA family outer membrane protein